LPNHLDPSTIRSLQTEGTLFSGPPLSLSGPPQICSFKNWCVFLYFALHSTIPKECPWGLLLSKDSVYFSAKNNCSFRYFSHYRKSSWSYFYFSFKIWRSVSDWLFFLGSQAGLFVRPQISTTLYWYDLVLFEVDVFCTRSYWYLSTVRIMMTPGSNLKIPVFPMVNVTDLFLNFFKKLF